MTLCLASSRVVVRLRHRASGRAAAAADGEDRVDTAVRRAVRVLHESHLAHRSVRGDERRHRIGAAILIRERELRIDSGTRSADSRMEMTTLAAVQIHSRPETLRDAFGRREFVQCAVEVFELWTRQTIERFSRARIAAARARIFCDRHLADGGRQQRALPYQMLSALSDSLSQTRTTESRQQKLRARRSSSVSMELPCASLPGCVTDSLDRE